MWAATGAGAVSGDVSTFRDVHFPPPFLLRGPLLWVFSFEPQRFVLASTEGEGPSPFLGGEGALCFPPHPRRTSRAPWVPDTSCAPAKRSDPPEANGNW